MPKPFVFNDQNQSNSYGFRILTAGISLKRFKKNPIMLDQHWNSTQSVLGKWENLKVENGLLLGEPLFDLEDENATKVSGKVDRGFINSCSMGITFNREDLKIIGTELVMEKCELYECSIVAVPSNANSIRLYSENGELLKDDDVKQLCLSLQDKNQLPTQEINQLEINSNNMKKVILSVASLMALSFDKNTPEVDVEAVEAAVLKLSNENTDLKAKVLALETEKENAQTLAITEMVDLAITEGKIPATKKDDFVNLAKANFELAKSTIEAIPAKKTLAADVSNPSGTTEMTKEAFQKLSLQEQLEYKTNHADEYKKLFNVK
jgi:HK97 family phage prohead protease